MTSRGSAARVGDMARGFAAVRRVVVERRPPGPLQPGYLDSLERCAAANTCPWCQRALAATQPRPRLVLNARVAAFIDWREAS